MAAKNAEDDGVNNVGMPEPSTGRIAIEAVGADVHLGDERVIYGDGRGEHGKTDPNTGEPYAKPKSAHVDADTANALVKMGKAKRA